MVSDRRAPMFLSVDFEPDEHLEAPRSGPVSWTGCHAMVQHLDELRGAFTEEAGVPVAVGWYLRMDPQMEALGGTIDHAADRFAEFVEPNDHDYVGLHVHRTRWDAGSDRWVIDGDEQLWLEFLRQGLDAYATRMGPPLRHRFTTIPSLTPAMLKVLAEAGVVVDLTEEPTAGPRWLSRTPNGASLPTSACPVTIIPGTSTSRPPHRGNALRKAARKARWPLSRWYLSPYRDGLAPMKYWDEVARSLDHMGDARYVSLALRTDPEGGRVDERHQALFGAFVRHPIRHHVRFADPLDFARSHANDL